MNSRDGAREREAAVRNLTAEGLTNDQIAPRLGITIGAVSRIAKRLGIPGTKAIRPDMRERIVELGKKRISVAEIRRRTDVSQVAIAKILDEAGIRRRGADEIWPGDTRYGRVVRKETCNG